MQPYQEKLLKKCHFLLKVSEKIIQDVKKIDSYNIFIIFSLIDDKYMINLYYFIFSFVLTIFL